MHYFIVGCILLFIYMILNINPIIVTYDLLPIYTIINLTVSIVLRIVVLYIIGEIMEKLNRNGIIIQYISIFIALLIPGLALIIQYLILPKKEKKIIDDKKEEHKESETN